MEALIELTYRLQNSNFWKRPGIVSLSCWRGVIRIDDAGLAWDKMFMSVSFFTAEATVLKDTTVASAVILMTLMGLAAR